MGICRGRHGATLRGALQGVDGFGGLELGATLLGCGRTGQGVDGPWCPVTLGLRGTGALVGPLPSRLFACRRLGREGKGHCAVVGRGLGGRGWNGMPGHGAGVVQARVLRLLRRCRGSDALKPCTKTLSQKHSRIANSIGMPPSKATQVVKLVPMHSQTLHARSSMVPSSLLDSLACKVLITCLSVPQQSPRAGSWENSPVPFKM